MANNREPLRPSEFINKIIQDANTGESFVPLIGSGLSSPSGIIMGIEFTNYLSFTTYLVLADPTKRPVTYGEGVAERWDLLRKGWPPLPSSEEVTQAKDWVKKQFIRLCSRLKLEVNYEDSGGSIKSIVAERNATSSLDLRYALTYPRIPTILKAANALQVDDYSRKLVDLLARSAAKEQYAASFAIDELVPDMSRSYHNRIIEMGIRALHDWRETLVFLSMIGIETRPNGEVSRLITRERDNSIIDSFNLFITRDKQPNLGHKILAHLASPLRIQTTLTTNFDTLTEDAYRAMSMSIRVLPVSARGRLPEARTVASEDCLVKLHGEAQDTRADLSLDEEPSAYDKATFASYLTRGAGHLKRDVAYAPHWSEKGNRLSAEGFSKRLLILGYSGADFRCVQMIRDWLESYRDSLVYWVCFSDGDVRHVQSLFGDEVYKDKVRICKSSRPDLMLYELYQRLVLSMPPGGMTYEFSHVVPPRRQRDFDFEEDRVRGALQCGRELGNPTEASRVLLGDSAAAIDVLRLTRDAISLRLKQVIVNAVKRESNFHLVDDPEINPERTLDPFVRCSLWKSPISRLTLDRVNSPIIIDAAGGVVRASAMAFDELTGAGYRVFWIETQDYMDADGLLRDLIRSLALRFGSFQSRQVTLHPRPCPIAESLDPQNSEMFESARRDIGDFLKDILREYRVNTARLAVLIYGRDGYGGCSGLLESNWKENGMDFLALHCVIGALATAGIKVLYFPLGKARSEVKTRKIKDWKVQLSRTNQLTETNTPFPRFLDSKKNWDSFNTKHSKESGRWQFDPLVDRTSFLAIDQTQGLLTPMINKIVATFYSFDSNMPTTLRPRFDRLRNYRKLTFFYALTLFRHSRLPNSLCSEASFACPFRFNDLGIDNDFLRSKESASWIAELRDARVFFDKPGGSIWMHRDVRLSLQQILEQTPIGEFAENFDESKLPRNYHFGELRSRLHFWIGDWYFKAFCSSGHLAPVVEALHHRLMAAKYAPIARQKLRRSIKGDSLASIWQYRLNLFESALLECSKTILISWHWLMLWQSSSFDASWVTKEHRESVIDSLTECMKSIVMGLNEVANSSKSKSKIKNTSLEGETSTEKRLSQAIQQFGHLLESLAEHLTVEGGGNKKLTCPYIEPRSAALCAVGDSAFAEKSPSAQKGVEHGLDFIRKPKAFFNRDLKSCFDSIVDDSNSATLVGVFSTILSVGESKMQIHRDANVAKMALAKANWKQGGFAVDKLHRMIWLLSETAYVFLRRAKLSYHATGRIDFSSWIISSAACNLGIDLCKHLPPSLVDFEVDAKIKLHEIYSIALANLGRFYESNRHLNIAQALLSKSRGQQKSDYGVLSMRRAESRLTECFWIRWFIELNEDGKWNDQVLTSDSFELTFGVSRFWFADSLGTSSWSEQLLKSRMKTELESDAARMLWVPPRISECFHKSINDAKKTGDLNANHFKNSKPHLRRLYSATLDEAVALLDQAERQLSGHSQSTLWWSRLHTLRLRIYGALSALGSDYTSMTASLCMRKYAPDTGIYNNFVNAYRIARHDDFRKLRTIKYFIEADDWYRTYVNGQEHVDRHKQNPSQSCLPEATGMAHQAYASLCTSLVSRAIDNPNGDSAKAIRLFCEAGTSFDTLELPRECINAASQHDLFASAVARVAIGTNSSLPSGDTSKKNLWLSTFSNAIDEYSKLQDGGF